MRSEPCPPPENTKPSKPASSAVPRPSAGPLCRARKPSNGAGLIRKSRPAVAPKNRSLFFDDLLDDKLREFNPRYAEAEGALLGQFCHLHTDIHGNREFVEHLRNRGKFFDHEEKASATWS